MQEIKGKIFQLYNINFQNNTYHRLYNIHIQPFHKKYNM